MLKIMPKPLLFVIKLLTVLIVAFFSYTSHIPMILYGVLGWCIWLWIVIPEWKGRLLAILGFGLTTLGWWGSLLLEGHYMALGDASHTGDQEGWGSIGIACFRVGVGIMAAGILLLAYVDYRRSPKPRSELGLTGEEKADQGQAWPPAPKQPQG